MLVACRTFQPDNGALGDLEVVGELATRDDFATGRYHDRQRTKPGQEPQRRQYHAGTTDAVTRRARAGPAGRWGGI